MNYVIAAVVVACAYLGAKALGYDLKAMFKAGWEKLKSYFQRKA